MEPEIELREFQAGDVEAFRLLNEEWITRHFEMEPKDELTLRDPQRYILDKGSKIVFALRGSEALGCCALLRIEAGAFEVAKMAVTEAARGQGVGRRVLEFAIAVARASGASRLYLETNGKLQPAIRLYESVGFRHVPAERVVPSSYARVDVYMELLIQ